MGTPQSRGFPSGVPSDGLGRATKGWRSAGCGREGCWNHQGMCPSTDHHHWSQLRPCTSPAPSPSLIVPSFSSHTPPYPHRLHLRSALGDRKVGLTDGTGSTGQLRSHPVRRHPHPSFHLVPVDQANSPGKPPENPRSRPPAEFGRCCPLCPMGRQEGFPLGQAGGHERGWVRSPQPSGRRRLGRGTGRIRHCKSPSPPPSPLTPQTAPPRPCRLRRANGGRPSNSSRISSTARGVYQPSIWNRDLFGTTSGPGSRTELVTRGRIDFAAAWISSWMGLAGPWCRSSSQFGEDCEAVS